MPLDAEALRDEVREGLGRVSTAEYSNDLIDAQILRALRRFSQHCPLIAQVTLALVKDVSFYGTDDLGLDDGVALLAILRDSWTHEGPVNRAAAFSRSLGRVSYPDPAASGLQGKARSLAAAAMDSFLGQIEQEMAEDNLERCLRLHGNQIVVVPTPSAASTQHLVVALGHDDETFPDEQYHDELVDCCKWLAGEELLALRDKFKSVNVGGVSKAEMDNSWLKKQVLEWERKFKTASRAIPPPIVPE